MDYNVSWYAFFNNDLSDELIRYLKDNSPRPTSPDKPGEGPNESRYLGKTKDWPSDYIYVHISKAFRSYSRA